VTPRRRRWSSTYLRPIKSCIRQNLREPRGLSRGNPGGRGRNELAKQFFHSSDITGLTRRENGQQTLFRG